MVRNWIRYSRRKQASEIDRKLICIIRMSGTDYSQAGRGLPTTYLSRLLENNNAVYISREWISYNNWFFRSDVSSRPAYFPFAPSLSSRLYSLIKPRVFDNKFKCLRIPTVNVSRYRYATLLHVHLPAKQTLTSIWQKL